MPEGDTIFRAATTLRRWLVGREVTAARSMVEKVAADRLVGLTVDAVESRAKHLLVRFSSGAVLHTHMRMTGSWHVYRTGERWRRPAFQARLVIECGDRSAVLFEAPVVELLAPGVAERLPSLVALGPDVLSDGGPDLAEVLRRARLRPPATTVGEVLLDQRVVGGIGNIYRAEALFLEGLHPSTPVGELSDADISRAVATAARLMAANVGTRAPGGRDVGAGSRQARVYGRAGRPCRRCSTPVEAALVGEPPRTAYWCPRCQPRAGSRGAGDPS